MKRKGRLYRPGYRSSHWIKVPVPHREEFIVGGYLHTCRHEETGLPRLFERYSGQSA